MEPIFHAIFKMGQWRRRRKIQFQYKYLGVKTEVKIQKPEESDAAILLE